jgi:hypothetical protein
MRFTYPVKRNRKFIEIDKLTLDTRTINQSDKPSGLVVRVSDY